jgi:YVTN family beta-propeller protein
MFVGNQYQQYWKFDVRDDGGPSPSHGIGIAPDQKTLLVNSRLNSATYAYTLPDLKLLGGAALGGRGAQWLTITPDNKIAYVANEQSDDVSVVDISLKEVARIPVGFNLARNQPTDCDRAGEGFSQFSNHYCAGNWRSNFRLAA